MMKWAGQPNLHHIKYNPEALLHHFYQARKFFREEHFGSESTWAAPLERALAFETLAAEDF